ncbi:hypothetical protein Cgig2_014311 [Carnegiea gigantea]|uniref:Transposase-associated domain-containing protein n=1 Tax=Carnegiea gigantea TaxID=171969 RepID=A0A9Q1JWN4_9CARY|nr:hypothetical protein Cgig2_014311 [Carnegiea gigantea]
MLGQNCTGGTLRIRLSPPAEMALNKEWMKLNRSSCDYIDGVDAFLNFSFRDVREEEKNTLTIRCPCDKRRNLLLKTRLEVRFDLLRCRIYEKYTTWEFHGESVDQFDEDNCREDNKNEGGYDSDEVNMLEDACGVAGMGLGIENEKDIEEHIYMNKQQVKQLRQGVPKDLSFEESNQIHLYVLHNCDELVEFVEEHKLELQRESPINLEKRHKSKFAKWIHKRVCIRLF